MHRFTEAWERHASLRLRADDPTVIDDYIAAGRVHDFPLEVAAYQGVLATYLDAAEQGRSALMLARTHHDVDALNALARGHAIDTGQVHGQVLADGPAEWRVGDRLRATRNNRNIPVGEEYLRNGDQFTVLGGAREGLLVQNLSSGQNARLPADYVARHTSYGWAATIDAAQGATVDHAVLLARPGIDREHLYVGLTRGRHSNHVYLAQTTIDIDRHRLPGTGELRTASDILADALSASGVQRAAHAQLPDHQRVDPPAQPTPARRTVQRPRLVRSSLRRPERPRPSIEPDDHYRPFAHEHGLDHDRDLGRGR